MIVILYQNLYNGIMCERRNKLVILYHIIYEICQYRNLNVAFYTFPLVKSLIQYSHCGCIEYGNNHVHPLKINKI